MLNDQQQTKKLFADGWTMIKGCSTDYSTTECRKTTEVLKSFSESSTNL